MKRGLALGILIAIGSLSMMVSGFRATPAGPIAAALAAIEIEKVQRWNDLKECTDFTQDFVAFARSRENARKKMDQAAAEYKVPAKYDGYVAGVIHSSGARRRTCSIIYDELKK